MCSVDGTYQQRADTNIYLETTTSKRDIYSLKLSVLYLCHIDESVIHVKRNS